MGSQDSVHLRSSCAAYEIIFWDVESCTAVPRSTVQGKEWHSCSCTLGREVLGIWPLHADGVDVNSVARSPDGSLLATTDEKGYVNLLKYPASTRTAKRVTQAAHSCHVTAAQFGANSKCLVST